MKIWDLAFGIKWDKAQIKKETQELKDSFKKMWDEIEKELWKNTIWWMEKKLKLLRDELNKTDVWTKRFKELQGAVSWVEKELDKVNNMAWKTTGVIGGLWKAFVWLFAADKLKDWALWIIELARQAEKTQVAFTNFTWSAKEANDILQLIREFAATTPFEFTELTDVSRKLMSIAWITKDNLIPTLTALWDIASSQWKSITQIVEAYNDAIVWEFERLKEFWIRASVEWDKVKFTFQWQTVEVAKTQEAIDWYIRSLAQAEWVQWGMEKQSQTLDWKISNLNDSWTNLWVTIWTKVIPYLKNTVDMLIWVVKWVWLVLSAIKIFATIWAGLFATWLIAMWELSWNIIWAIIENVKLIPYNFWVAFSNIPWTIEAWLKGALRLVWDFINKVTFWLWWVLSKKLWLWKMVDDLNTFGSKNLKFKSVWITWANFKMTTGSVEKLMWEVNNLKSLFNSSDIVVDTNSSNSSSNWLKLNSWWNTKAKKSKWSWKSEIEELKKKLEEEKKLKQKAADEEFAQYKKYKEHKEKLEKEKQDKLKKWLDSLKSAYKDVVDVINDQINKTKDNIKDFDSKIKDSVDKITDLKKTLWDLYNDKAKNLWERNVEIVNRLPEIQKELKAMKYKWVDSNVANSIWKSTLEAMNSWDIIWNATVEDLLKSIELTDEYNKLLAEQQLIKANTTDRQLSEAKKNADLSPTEKYLKDFEEKRIVAELQKKDEEKRLKDLQDWKSAEQLILENFNITKNTIDTNYATQKAIIEAQITDNLVTEIWKREKALNEFKARQSEFYVSQTSVKPEALPWFSDWWYTGDWPTNEVAWLVHRSEYVIDAETIKKIPGIIWQIEAYKRGNTTNNYNKSVNVPAIYNNSQVDFETALYKLKWRL